MNKETNDVPVTVELEPLALRLAIAQTASCSCDTKTNEACLHDPRCLYRVLQDAQAEIDRLTALNDKYFWQVRDTCTRAEKAEAALASAPAEATKPLQRSREWWLSRIDAEPDVAIGAGVMARAYEVVRHDPTCPAIGGAGDKDCRCDAVPFLNDLANVLTIPKPASAPAGDGVEDREVARMREMARDVLYRHLETATGYLAYDIREIIDDNPDVTSHASYGVVQAILNAMAEYAALARPRAAVGEREALVKRLENAKWTYAGAKQDVCSIDPDDVDAVILALQSPPAKENNNGG